MIPPICHRCHGFTDEDIEILKHYKAVHASRGYRIPSDVLAIFSLQQAKLLKTLARDIGEWVAVSTLGQILGGIDAGAVATIVYSIRKRLPAGYLVENSPGNGYRLRVEAA